MQYRLAGWGLERMADRLGVRIEKALNPLDPADFVLIIARLASALNGATRGQEALALKAAVQALDVDWPNLSEAAQYAVYSAAKNEMAKAISASVSAGIVLSRSTIVDASKAAAVKAFGLSIEPSPTPLYKTVANLLRRSQMVYIKDEYGKRSIVLDQQARDIVAQGLERGLGRAEIAEELSVSLSAYQINRSDNYWRLIASDFATKGRTAAQVYSMDEAGIERYQWSAVADEATCLECSLLDGKTWSVQTLKRQLDYALKLDEPEDIQNARPFLRHSGKDIFFERNGVRYTVESDGKQIMSDDEMESAGLTAPPIHGRCRCTIVMAD